jgi:hypothetical protein
MGRDKKEPAYRSQSMEERIKNVEESFGRQHNRLLFNEGGQGNGAQGNKTKRLSGEDGDAC